MDDGVMMESESVTVGIIMLLLGLLGEPQKAVPIRRDLMASPEKKIANFRFPCGHKVAQQTGNRIDSTQVDEKINFDFRGDPLEGRKLKISEPFPDLAKVE